MKLISDINLTKKPDVKTPGVAFLFDLILYLSIMFLIREIYFADISFIANGLFWSFSTLLIAAWRMQARGVSWQLLGLTKPNSWSKMLLVTGFILLLAPVLIIVFQIIKDQIPYFIAADTSEQTATTKFGELAGNWLLFFMIIPFIWIQSALEEILDRGFLINWLERMFSKTILVTVMAVIIQAMIFGFRHSYDLSERSITVGLIGLVMGIAYVAFGRNLWPLIIAHCLLNTLSMIDRVV